MSEISNNNLLQMTKNSVVTFSASLWMQSFAKQIIILTLCLIIAEILFPYFIHYLKTRSHFELEDFAVLEQKNVDIQKESIQTEIKKLFKINFVKFKYVVTATFVFFWIGLFFYSLSFINFISIWQTISSQFTAVFIFKILGLAACGYSYITLVIPIFICSKSLWIFIFILTLGFFTVITILDLKKPTGFFSSLLYRFTPNSVSTFLSSITLKLEEVRKAVDVVNELIVSLLSYLSFSSILFVIQLVLISNLIFHLKMPLCAVIPLLFLIDWSFNFYTSITKFSTYVFIDRYNTYNKNKLNSPEVKNNLNTGNDPNDIKSSELKDPISFKLLLKNAPYICVISLQLTIFSFFNSINQIINFLPYSSSPVMKYVLDTIDSAKVFIEIVFQLAECFTDQRLFFLALVNNHLDAHSEVEIKNSDENEEPVESNIENQHDNEISENDPRYEYLANVSSKIFSSTDATIMTVVGLKNSAIRVALHSTIFSYSILGLDEVKKFSSSFLNPGSEPFQFFEIIFQKIDVASICVFLFFVFLVNYFLAVESAYIINKKPEAEMKIQEEKRRKEEEEKLAQIIAKPSKNGDKTVVKRVLENGIKVVEFFKKILIKPNEYGNYSLEEDEIDFFPSFTITEEHPNLQTEESDRVFPSNFLGDPGTLRNSNGEFTFD